jgi:glycosyltransferase involved in cell wall biosynthesis
MINPLQPDYTNTPVSSKRSKFTYSPVNFQTQPAISIVTPFYNTKEIFHETAQSVLNQSLQQWEWLIINDGSNNPESLEALNKYRDIDPRIRIIDLVENRGPSSARNIGFAKAASEYVLQLDSDDLLEPTAAEKWLWFLFTHPQFSFVKGYSIGFEAEQYLWTRGFHEGSTFLRENLVEPIALLRKSTHQAIGGYDEKNQDGLEDWDFWLKCASHGYWGDTIPEYHSWYRRRPNHESRWRNWGNKDCKSEFHKELRRHYPNLWQGSFPNIQKHWHQPYEPVKFSFPFNNLLKKNKKRLLMILPWLNMGGSDKFNLDLIEQLKKNNWEVSIVTTAYGDYSWESEFSRFTPDIFVLPRFLYTIDYPRFLHYLIQSRNPDVVLISNSEIGYLLLPYLRACCPNQVFVDYCHIEEMEWKNGGYARKALVYQEQLDLNIVASSHLREWMIKNGGEKDRIEVCYINVDTNFWKPDSEKRALIRAEYGIDEHTCVIVFAGRILDQKQPFVLAKTLLSLSQKGHNFIAFIAGDGPDKMGLERFIRKYKVLSNKVKFLGAQPSAKIREIMQASDIFFLPSKHEGIALTLFEAMACELAVIGADVGGQKELVTPESGILISKISNYIESDHYAEIISNLLYDIPTVKKFGTSARYRVEKGFKIEKMGKEMIRLFKKAKNYKKESPRTPVPISLGYITAQEAVESMRLFNLSEELWYQKDRIKHVPLSIRIYTTIRNVFLPFYNQINGENSTYIHAAKELLKKITKA